MIFQKNPNFLKFSLLVFLHQITSALSGPTIYDLFPQASKFYEKKFCDRKPSMWNLWSPPKGVCINRDIYERIEICKGILKRIKSSSELTLVSEGTSITAEESKCVNLPVVFHWLPGTDMEVEAYRCPLKFSLDSPIYAVGGLDPKYASFYIVQGETPKGIYVLFDVMEGKNENAPGPVVQLPNDVSEDLDTENRGTETIEVESSREPLDQLSNEATDDVASVSQDAEISKVKLSPTQIAEGTFLQILADTDRRLYISRLFRVDKVIVENSVRYKFAEVPDFSQMRKVST